MPENYVKPHGLKLKKNYYEPPAESGANTSENSVDSAFAAPALEKARRRNKAKQNLRQNIRLAFSWFLFILLGGGLVYIRFFEGWPAIAPDILKQYGMIAVGILYLTAVFLAVKDNMFDGLLALIVPFYPFYYLFFKSGSPLLCAIVAAFLAAFGFDCLLFLQRFLLKMMDRTTSLIQNV
ncbi:MAG: hypothetical protein PHP98_07165 [Kiritimatiellae bacterium]|jgi:hypothetical protein|nr:hypothetical protein [Kiritimatiellia bacterium]